MKKTIALLIVFSLVVAFLPGVSVEAAATSLTVEDILNDYHAKVFATRLAEEQGDVAVYSRGGSAVSLEQETVQILTDAGYEAYNVTSDNYDELEVSLQTDFTEMGLDPDGSYIVVISGEDGNGRSNPSTRDMILPPHEWEDPSDGDNTFLYTFRGVTYTMRFFIVTYANDSRLGVNSEYDIVDENLPSEEILEIINAVFWCGVGSAMGIVADVISLFADIWDDGNYTELGAKGLSIYAGTTWTYDHIQVWDASENSWHTAQRSAYAISFANLITNKYNTGTNSFHIYVGERQEFTTYSPNYNFPISRRTDAVAAFINGTQAYDDTGNIRFYMCDDESVDVNANGRFLFEHTQPPRYIIA